MIAYRHRRGLSGPGQEAHDGVHAGQDHGVLGDRSDTGRSVEGVDPARRPGRADQSRGATVGGIAAPGLRRAAVQDPRAVRRLRRRGVRGPGERLPRRSIFKEADTVLDQLVETFRHKGVPAPVLATIVEQAEATHTQLHDQA
jgi:hypothetical protein